MHTATQLHKMTYQIVGIGAVVVVVVISVNLIQTVQFDFYLQISNVHFSLADDHGLHFDSTLSNDCPLLACCASERLRTSTCCSQSIEQSETKENVSK